jgi:hypothetical protein
LENQNDETRRTAYKNGYTEGYKKGYEKGYEEATEKAKHKAHPTQVQFLRITCECGTTNFHPVFENKLIINDDEERRCYGCGKIIARDEILNDYSRLQPKT